MGTILNPHPEKRIRANEPRFMAHASGRANLVFYAQAYHPIQAGSIDGTDVTPHDNGVYRALLASQTGLYDPTGDRKAIGDPHCTLFVGRLSRDTTEETLLQAMSKYGRVKSVRLVRHIVTGASQGYAFVEYETERDFRHAYEEAHHATIDGNQVIVDYNRQQLMSGWIPRRLGGGLGGHKESGQLRFGGRERPFRAPLRPIPYEELKKLGIPLPPEGHYMSRFQIPPPPTRKVEEREKGGDHRSIPRKAGSQDPGSSRKGREDQGGDHRSVLRKAGSQDPGSSRKGREDHDVDRQTDGLDESLDDTHSHESKDRRTERKRSREERHDEHIHRERKKHNHHSGSSTRHDHHRSRSPRRHGHSRSHGHSKSSRHGSRSPKYQDYHESSKDRY